MNSVTAFDQLIPMPENGTDGQSAPSVGITVSCHDGTNANTDLCGIYVNGIKVTRVEGIDFTPLRGHSLLIVDSLTMEPVYAMRYDTFGSPDLCDTITNHIARHYNLRYIYILISADACSCTQQLRTFLSYFGGKAEGTWEPRRRAHYFIGQPELKPGQGYEAWSDDPTQQIVQVNVNIGIGIVVNGANGEPGEQGPQGPQGPQGIIGATGPMPYPAGEYSPTVTYTRTEHTVPFVLYKGQYYILNTDSSRNNQPDMNYAMYGKNSKWLLMERYQALLVEMLIADLGKVGSAIFYGQYMFSQYGRVGNTVVDQNGGTYAIPTDAGGTFTPNLLIDFLRGRLCCNDVELTGRIKATSGEFSGEVIQRPLHINADNFSDFFRLVNSTTIPGVGKLSRYYQFVFIGSSMSIVIDSLPNWLTEYDSLFVDPPALFDYQHTTAEERIMVRQMLGCHYGIYNMTDYEKIAYDNDLVTGPIGARSFVILRMDYQDGFFRWNRAVSGSVDDPVYYGH